MGSNERMAVAAHLHVALRRKAGRVTDTDWMAVNDAYAREVVRVARAYAHEEGDAALAALAAKLEGHIAAPAVQGPQQERLPPRGLQAGAPPSAPEVTSEDAGRYIGRLR